MPWKAGSGGFLRALLGLPHNPLALREWRGLAHQARDWRLWLGLRIPKDARGWGVPAIVWFALAPYIVLGALRLANRISPGTFQHPPQPGLPQVDALGLCMGLLSLYGALIAIGLMAPVITRERERETWESLRSTTTTGHEIVLGLVAGRLGPILAALAAVGLAWILLRPHYAPLFQPLAPFTLDARQVGLLVLLSCAVCLALGLLATATSACCRSTGMAVVAATAGALVLGALGVVAALSPLPDAYPALHAGLAVVGVGCYWLAVRNL